MVSGAKRLGVQILNCITVDRDLDQWPFQVPKVEVLYHKYKDT